MFSKYLNDDKYVKRRGGQQQQIVIPIGQHSILALDNYRPHHPRRMHQRLRHRLADQHTPDG